MLSGGEGRDVRASLPFLCAVDIFCDCDIAVFARSQFACAGLELWCGLGFSRVMKPDFEFERAAHARGFERVAGVDEVGRGPLAGPVTAAAVVLDPDRIPEGLNDSKKLTKAARERLYEELLQVADVSVAHASVEEIEELNILRASHLAMLRALEGLKTPADYARPQLRPKYVEIVSCCPWRNSTPDMAGKPTWDTGRKSTWRRCRKLV
jgi:ribonuclease HII